MRLIPSLAGNLGLIGTILTRRAGLLRDESFTPASLPLDVTMAVFEYWTRLVAEGPYFPKGGKQRKEGGGSGGQVGMPDPKYWP